MKLETGDRLAATLDEISGTLAAIVDTQCRIADALEICRRHATHRTLDARRHIRK